MSIERLCTWSIRIILVFPNAIPVLAFNIVQGSHQDIVKGIWEKFIPEALANGSFQAKPDFSVAGHGLEDIQKGIDAQRKGVSARKVVVTL